MKPIYAILVLVLAGLACQGGLTGFPEVSPEMTVTPAATSPNVAMLASPSTTSPVVAMGAPVTVCKATGHLHVRSGPGVEHPVVSWLEPGQDVVLLAEAGNWMEVEADGARGFAHGRWIECGEVE